MKFKQVKALLITSALAAATIAAAGCGKKEEEQVSVSAEVEQAAAYNFKGSDLDGYITGLENRTVLKGASFSQWFEGVKADPDIVKEVIADVGDADANTAGTYDVEVKVIVDAAALDEAKRVLFTAVVEELALFVSVFPSLRRRPTHELFSQLLAALLYG